MDTKNNFRSKLREQIYNFIETEIRNKRITARKHTNKRIIRILFKAPSK